MEVISYVTANVLAVLFFALVAGVLIDVFISKQAVASLVLPLVIGGIWYVGWSVESSNAEQAARLKRVEGCAVIGETKASFYQQRQVGYRCPAKDGKPASEHWLNENGRG